MDNRTIRRAVTRRVPEIYYIDAPIKVPGKVAWLMLAKINGRPYKLIADMPDTSLVSHNELLTTMVSELYDHVAKIKRGSISPQIALGEDLLTPLSDEELSVFNYSRMGEMVEDQLGASVARNM